MSTFRASNGVTIRFKIRDCPRNFYMVADRGQPELELEVTDFGKMRRMCDDPIPQSWRDAYVEYVENEIAEFDHWCSGKPYLLTESVDESRQSLQRKLELAKRNQGAKLPYGYVAYTGKMLHDRDVDEYNRIREEIEGKRIAGLPVPEWLLNYSHRKFVEIATIHETAVA